MKLPFFMEDPTVRKAFLDCVKLGMPIADCLAYAGIGKDSYYDAMKRGEAAIANGESNRYSEFCESVKKAQGEFARNNLAIIQQAAVKKDWHAAAWLLERRRPKDFALKQEISGEGVTLTIVNDVPKR